MSKLHTEYLQLPDIKVAYKEYGKGKALILLHGNSQSKELFPKYQTEYFNMFHTIAIDSRGHGESSSGDINLSIEQFSKDIIRFCEVKNINNAYVIGYSDGGNISLFLADRAPHIFKRVVAISPNYLSSGVKKVPLLIVRILKKIANILGHTGLKTQNFIMKLDLILNNIGITENELKSIKVDFKILYAEHDIVKEEHIQKISELISGCSCRKIKRCNHLTILHKKETIETIKQFLKK